MHDYGNKSLVFEVRGLDTKAYRGSKIGVIFEATDGYAVSSSYSGGVIFDKDGNKITEFDEGDDKFHAANFIKAMRSRKLSDLNADIEEGHLSSALCHLGNISYRLGTQMSGDELDKSLANLKTTDNAKDTMERTLAHLKDNGVDLSAIKMQVGPTLAFDSMSERFPGNEVADKMLTRVYRKPFVVPEAGQV